MARVVTLEDLREDIRILADLPTFSTTGNITTIAVDRFINSALQEYYGLLMECWGNDYFDTEFSFSTVADVEVSSLPSDCSKIRSLLWLRGTDDVVPLHRAATSDVLLAGYGSQSWDTYAPRYRIQNQAIRWYPKPSAAYPLILTYSALPDDLVQDTDEFSGYGVGHEKYVVSEVCRRIAVRQDKDPTPFIMERAESEAKIRKQALVRDESTPLALTDITSGVATGESAWAKRDRLTR